MVSNYSSGFLPNRCCETFSIELFYLSNFFENDVYNEPDKFKRYIKEYEFSKINQNIVKNLLSRDKTTLDISKLRYIYTATSFLVHRFIWCGETERIIPACIGVPWYYSSKVLGLPTVLTYSSVALWNWRLKDIKQPFSLDNLECIHFLTTTLEERRSEEWFYLISTAIEGCCSDMVSLAKENLEFLDSTIINKNKNWHNEIIANDIALDSLLKLSNLLDKQNKIMNRMTERCDPEIFFNTHRMYLWGSSKIQNGIMIDSCDDIPPLNFAGASAAQSALIQLEDIFLGVKHNKSHFLMEQRKYMPNDQRKLLEEMEKYNSINYYIKSGIITSPKAIQMYNRCVNKLVEFRKIHHKIVQNYIVKQSDTNYKATGTGGTPLDTFLTSIINKTNNSIIPINDIHYYEKYSFINRFIITLIIMIISVVIIKVIY